MSNDTQIAAHITLVTRYADGEAWLHEVEASARQLAEQGARDKPHRDLFFAAYHLLDGVCEDHPALADVLNVDAHGALCHALAQLDSFYGVNGTEDVAAHFQVEPGSRLEYELHVLESRTRAKGVDPRDLLETALARIEDMLADDDGQAFKEARKFLESARHLSEQPGFVMVPVEPTNEMVFDGAQIDGVLDYDLAAKVYRAMIQARPLTASPTAPSTEASEPVCVPSVGDIWLDSTGTHQITAVDRGVITTSPVVKAARTTPPPAPVLSDAEERAEFEAWIAKDGGDLSMFGNAPHRHYKNRAVMQSWEAWQARAGRASRGAK